MKKIAVALLAGLFCLPFGACQEKTADITVYMPDGAPALALAELMSKDSEEDGVSYRVVTPSLIASKVTNKEEEKNADLCVMPLTAASKLLGKGDRYVMLGAVTHGNLYLVAKSGEYTAENLSSLLGKKIGVLQMNEVPGLTLKAVLNSLQIPWSAMTNEGGMVADKVNLTPIGGADAVGTVEADCFLLAEPAASAQKKKGYSIAGDLQALYGEGKGYPQAVLVAKKSLAQEKKTWLRDFLAKVEEGSEWLKTATGETLVQTISAHMEDSQTATTLKAPLLNGEVLSRCGIRFAYATEYRAQTETFLSALLAVNDKAAAMPSVNFYWEY